MKENIRKMDKVRMKEWIDERMNDEWLLAQKRMNDEIFKLRKHNFIK